MSDEPGKVGQADEVNRDALHSQPCSLARHKGAGTLHFHVTGVPLAPIRGEREGGEVRKYEGGSGKYSKVPASWGSDARMGVDSKLSKLEK